MADTAVVESDIVPPGPGGKRKRGTESASPDARRTRRNAPTAAMTTTDASTAAFIQSAVSAAEAAGGHVSVDDFSALQHATADHTDAADPANAAGTAAAALNSIYPTLNVPQSTEETFAAQVGAESPQQDESTFAPEARFPGNPKPQVGSEEWHKLRKDNHKEVERRRRETINEGINELAKQVPGSEKNKGSILSRAVSFIQQLKENEAQNIEKWTLEKLLTEQAIAELSSTNEKLQQDYKRMYTELEMWKKLAQDNGLQPPKEDEETPS